MNENGRQHIFWGSASPLGGLAGGGMLIMASSRLAYAIIAASALLWVYCLSSLTSPCKRIFPRQGGTFITLFFSSFWVSVYLFLLWLASPLCALETFFIVPLIPLFCAASGLVRRIESLEPGDALYRSASEALVFGLLIIAFSLVREPLGFGSLSLPGGAGGIILLCSFGGEYFLPIRIIAGSAGALLLLGYGVALYRYMKSVYAPREWNE